MKKTNEIGNKELNENIANTALGLLQKNIEYINLNFTKVEFGYLFDIENHGIEALFKVVTDKITAYFAVQGTNLMRVGLSEYMFQVTTDTFLRKNGECL